MKKSNSLLKKLPGYIGYGVGAVGLDLSYGMFYSFLSYYLSSVLGLKPAFLLILTPIARIWDGINDPMMGTIVDNTRTKFGKYRPWILIGAFSNAVVLTLLFTSFGMSGTKLYIYIAAMYILWGMTNTMADIPYWSMIPSFTSEAKERSLVATIARTFSGLGQGIITILTPIILPLLSTGMTTEKGYSATGFSRWAMICGIALILFFGYMRIQYKRDKRCLQRKAKIQLQADIQNRGSQRSARRIYDIRHAFKCRLVPDKLYGCLLFHRCFGPA